MSVESLMIIDCHVLSVVNAWRGRYAALDWFMIAIAKYGPLIIDFYLIVLWFSGGNEEKFELNRKRAIYAATSALLALGLNQVIGYTWFRQRAYVIHPIHLLLSSSSNPSFPSDHAAGGFSISTGVLFGHPVHGFLLKFVAGLVAFARVYVGIH